MDVHEWFVHVRNAGSGAVVWQDWFDYLGYSDDDSESELAGQMNEDIAAVVRLLLSASALRVLPATGLFGVASAQACIEGEWTPLASVL